VTEVPGLLEAARVHVSGCAKGCARRAAADLTLVGKDGRYGVVIRGSARDEPLVRMEIREIVDRLKTIEGSFATQSSRRLRRALAAT
jgi:precorrin-3B synthase